MDNNKVGIKNISNRNVGLTVKDLRLHRVILPKQTIYLTKEVLEEALTYPGVQYLFDNKYLALNDVDFGMEQGILTDEDVDKVNDVLVQKNVQDEEEIKRIVNFGTDFELKKLLADETEARKQVIADIAANCEGLTMSKIDIIKRLTGIDLNKIVK